MRNVRRDGNRVHFLINGGDLRASVIAIAVILLVLAGALGLAWLGLAQESWVLALTPLLAMFPFLIVVLRVLGSGWLARYRLTVDRAAGTVTATDLRQARTLFEGPLRPERLYLARTRVQIGYVSSLKDVLAYGDPPQDVVEDGEPSERLTVLTIAPRRDLEVLARELGGTVE